jgi:hypothetical protein
MGTNRRLVMAVGAVDEVYLANCAAPPQAEFLKAPDIFDRNVLST